LSMNNLHLSEEAKNDLLEIKTYIEEELLNPSAALATVSRITKSLRILLNHAQAGAPLSSIADIESDYRFIVSGNYISFYRAYGSEVFIDRILYARRDYMRILFGDNTAVE
jgi:toxin ParE1/3/4